MRLDFREIIQQANGRWFQLLLFLAPELTSAIAKCPRHVPCPRHGGKDGFRFFRDGNDRGAAICNTCGAFPSGIQLLRWLKGWEVKTAFEHVADFLGFREGLSSRPVCKTASNIVAPSIQPKRSFVEQSSIERLWSEALSPNDASATVLQLYLKNRGLGDVTPIPSAIRFHPKLPYFQDGEEIGKFPAMLAKIQDVKSNLVGVHRTYLNNDGFKASVPSNKKIFGPAIDGALSGAAIPLYEPGKMLAIAEGIETALAVYMATKIPTWSSVSAVLMEKCQVPRITEKVFICADLDRSGTGERAARKLAGRLLSEGRDARIIRIPLVISDEETKGFDWLDVVTGKVKL